MTDISMVRPNTQTDLAGPRRDASDFIEGPRAIAVITGLIIINAVALGLETDAGIMAHYGDWLRALDKIILVLFTVELAIKFYAYRWDFFPIWLEYF